MWEGWLGSAVLRMVALPVLGGSPCAVVEQVGAAV